jgi:hypothetical protein
MQITFTSLIARSISHNEIAHASMSTMIRAMRSAAAEAGDDECVRLCDEAACVVDGTCEEDEATARRILADCREAILAGHPDVESNVVSGDTWEIWGVDEETCEDWRLAIDLTA